MSGRIHALVALVLVLTMPACFPTGELRPIEIPMYYEGNNPSLGYQTAPLTIVAYTDFACGACKKEALILREIQEENPDLIKLIFRHYPLKQHEQALPAAKAAQAASFQGRFWDMHDQIFNHQSELNDELYVKLGQNIGLNMIMFMDDLIKPATEMLINQDIAAGDKIGLQATPTLVINQSIVLQGLHSKDDIQRVLDQELRKMGR